MKATLTKEFLHIPVWGWVAGVGVAIIGFIMFKKMGGGSGASSSSGSAAPAADDATSGNGDLSMPYPTDNSGTKTKPLGKPTPLSKPLTEHQKEYLKLHPGTPLNKIPPVALPASSVQHTTQPSNFKAVKGVTPHSAAWQHEHALEYAKLHGKPKAPPPPAPDSVMGTVGKEAEATEAA